MNADGPVDCEPEQHGHFIKVAMYHVPCTMYQGLHFDSCYMIHDRYDQEYQPRKRLFDEIHERKIARSGGSSDVSAKIDRVASSGALCDHEKPKAVLGGRTHDGLVRGPDYERFEGIGVA